MMMRGDESAPVIYTFTGTGNPGPAATFSPVHIGPEFLFGKKAQKVTVQNFRFVATPSQKISANMWISGADLFPMRCL